MQSKKNQSSGLKGQRAERISKLKTLRELGIDPYPAQAHRTHYTGQLHSQFADLAGQEVTVSGRVMSFRTHGKVAFADIQDYQGKIQFLIKEDTLGGLDSETQKLGFPELNLIDVGDIIEGRGALVESKSGEISVAVSHIRMLTKAIRPIPTSWEGLKDKELLMRQRYLDMILNPDKRFRFEAAAKITFAIRQFLNERGFLETKTPILQPIYGGTNAHPFKTKVRALDVDFYLAVAHELYLKRLIVAGFENIYNMTGYFRNEGIDRTHNPEFAMVETMTAYQNYEYNMELMEQMYKFIGESVYDKTNFTVGGEEIDFAKPWERISMVDAVKKHVGADFDPITDLASAHRILTEHGIEELPNTIGESLVKLFEEKVEEKLIQPTFVYGHPVEISPLAKSMSSDPRYAERFEIFIGGIEGGDNWTELNDPLELYERFKDQVEKGRGGDDESHPMDVEFIEAMEYGMPPTTGIGPGVERLTMMYTETNYIDDVIFFPMLRPAPVTKLQKDLYGSEFVEIQKQKKSENITNDSSQNHDDLAIPTIEDARNLVSENVSDDYQKYHAEMVGHIMRGLAEIFKEQRPESSENFEPELWQITGLVHDWDYGFDPEGHPESNVDKLRELGYPEITIEAILGHKVELGTERKSMLSRALLATDELAGIIAAYSRLKGDFKSMNAKGVLKKFKDKRFAAKINREDINRGVEELGISLKEHIENVLKTLEDFAANS